MKKTISAGHICLDITPVFPSGKQVERNKPELFGSAGRAG